MKILISWLGFKEDFDFNGKTVRVKPSDFTGTIHRDIIQTYKYEKHIVIATKDDSNTIADELSKKCRVMSQFVSDTYPKHKFEIKYIDIDKSELQDFAVIESKIRSFIQTFDATDELHIVAGTGPTALSMVWSSLRMAMENKFKLFLMQRAEYTPGGKTAILLEINPFVSPWMDNKIMEYHFNNDIPESIYQDELIIEEYKKAQNISKADINVLILGETGCGKDVMANYIVEKSPLAKKNYKAINCASLSDDVLESELFGHVKGSFTDAIDDRIGLFESCRGGTLFLDEIGDISKYMQQSLLRAIENKEIKRKGSNEIIKNVDVRIIAATNNDLYEKCKKGDFRWDLYYRLCSTEIYILPYRERTAEQRKKIINYYLKKVETKWGKKIKFSNDAKDVFYDYQFPGNFREIYNTINGLFALGMENITVKDLPKRLIHNDAYIEENHELVLKNHCIGIYEKYNRNISAACKALGYENSTQFKTKLIKWGVL